MENFIKHDSVADPGDVLQERKIQNNIDVTDVINSMMPERWTCPHCGQISKTGMYANDIIFENGRYIEQCRLCGYLHIFRLILTNDFKKKVVDFIKNYSEQ